MYDDDVISSDIEMLRKQLRDCTKEDLCELLDSYVKTINIECPKIGVAEFNTYVQLLTEEINRYD